MLCLNNLISPSALACSCNRAASERDEDIVLCPIEETIPHCPFNKSCGEVTESDWRTYLSSFGTYRLYDVSEFDEELLVHEDNEFHDDYKIFIVKKINSTGKWYQAYLCVPKSKGVDWVSISDNIRFDYDIDVSNINDNEHRKYIDPSIEEDYDIYHWSYHPYYRCTSKVKSMRVDSVSTIIYDAHHIINQIECMIEKDNEAQG